MIAMRLWMYLVVRLLLGRRTGAGFWGQGDGFGIGGCGLLHMTFFMFLVLLGWRALAGLGQALALHSEDGLHMKMGFRLTAYC